eukprot:TRINITY_DN121732_c0_g1_i1.p1 TRINITY_DN121732_c0_g1~~TRINITY_DN121732_c0_g1_i1.p1  ORF type:complete len:479 (-),score=143.10 TRINITY_DN121732_c0_g1_i1:137-1465(-)
MSTGRAFGYPEAANIAAAAAASIATDAAFLKSRRAASGSNAAPSQPGRRVERLPQMQRSASGRVATPLPPVDGVSAAWLFTFCKELGQLAEKSPEARATRTVAMSRKKELQAFGKAGPYLELLRDELHFVTRKPIVAKASVHVAHAWDAGFPELVDCIVADSDGQLDRYYVVDVFTTDLNEEQADPVSGIRNSLAVVDEVLIVLDSEAIALRRLWVLFEAMLALSIGKRLRVRSAASEKGFGSSTADLKRWEAYVDATDWVLAETRKQGDEKRIRGFVERSWEQSGRGVERMLSQLKVVLRREIYGQIFIKAVEAGDLQAVKSALDMGVSPELMDGNGNTAEDLASFGGRSDIEELLFERRMGGQAHKALSEFFSAAELSQAQERAHPDVLQPFLTEAEEVGEASTAASSASQLGGPRSHRSSVGVNVYYDHGYDSEGSAAH